MINHRRTAIPTPKGENSDHEPARTLRKMGLVEILWRVVIGHG